MLYGCLCVNMELSNVTVASSASCVVCEGGDW